MPVPTFASLGSAAKDLLAGGKGDPAFAPDAHKVTGSFKTADGITLTPTVAIKAGVADLSAKLAYAHKRYAADATINATSKVPINASVADVAPGLKLSAAATLPDSSSAKLTADYAGAYAAVKATASLTSAPAVDIVASTGHKNFIFGGEAGFDTAKSAVSKWSLGAGYHAADSQFAAILGDKGKTLKLLAHHRYAAGKAVAAEAARDLSAGTTAFALGHSTKLASGALFKLKVAHTGALSSVYEQKLASGEKVALSAQLSALNLSAPIKYGLAAEIN